MVYDIFALTNPEYCKLTNRLHYGLLLGRTLKKAKTIIVPSNYVKKKIITQGIEEQKIEVIHPAVELSEPLAVSDI